ncbi:MAG: glycosyltransferase [Vicinamibacterales bacterium]
MTPLSVVVPTHGRVDLVLETLASLRAQSIDTFEVVVTDDSPRSEDREAIAAALGAYIDATGRPARYLFTAPRLGQARNTNQGLAAASGDYLRILHSDDLLAPRALETELGILTDPRLDARLLYHDVEPFRTRPRFARQPGLELVQPSLLAHSVLHSGTPLPSATVFHRDLLAAIGGSMREDFDFLCDWDFALRLVVAEHRRHGVIAHLGPGFVGWRLHGDSTTGRLWHRHFLEHEQLMAELAADTVLAESLIGDAGRREAFFASAVRYRYRRLASDVAGLGLSRTLTGLPTILRCALSPASVAARLTPAPQSWLGRLRHPDLAMRTEPAVAVTAPARDPRQGVRFAFGAQFAAAVIRAGKAHAARVGAPDDTAQAAPAGPAPPAIGGVLEVRPCMGGARAEAGRTLVLTEYNNSTNTWPLRRLFAGATHVVLTALNGNAFAEPVLSQIARVVPAGARLEVPLTDNHHLTSFGFKALLDTLAPGEFAWDGQSRAQGPAHVLTYRRVKAPHATYTTPHTGWTFGLLTTGSRLENVERFVDSIGAFCREPHEILIVSPVSLGAIETRPHVRVLRFSERDELGWITRKKNLVCAEARYSDILVCHDRFSLTPDFCEAMAAWGFSYGLAAMHVRLPDGGRGLDWAVVSSQNRVWSSGGLLDYRAWSQYAYNPGGATLIRRAYWQDVPWNENLFWNEHEDVELCRRAQRAGGVIALADATLIAAEDRWVHHNPRIPFCEENDVLYGKPVGEQRIRFLAEKAA